MVGCVFVLTITLLKKEAGHLEKKTLVKERELLDINKKWTTWWG